jgi:hypothetical protein
LGCSSIIWIYINRLFWKTNSKFFGIGALGGASWFLWWRLVWNGNTNPSLTTYLGGYSTFFALAGGLYHPRAAYRMGVFGLGLGILLKIYIIKDY